MQSNDDMSTLAGNPVYQQTNSFMEDNDRQLEQFLEDVKLTQSIKVKLTRKNKRMQLEDISAAAVVPLADQYSKYKALNFKSEKRKGGIVKPKSSNMEFLQEVTVAKGLQSEGEEQAFNFKTSQQQRCPPIPQMGGGFKLLQRLNHHTSLDSFKQPECKRPAGAKFGNSPHILNIQRERDGNIPTPPRPKHLAKMNNTLQGGFNSTDSKFLNHRELSSIQNISDEI